MGIIFITFANNEMRLGMIVYNNDLNFIDIDQYLTELWPLDFIFVRSDLLRWGGGGILVSFMG
jgi:hypothetical protein